jgi:hypothetical protein
MSLSRSLQYLFLAIIVMTVGFSLYQWNASRASTQKTAPNNGLVGYWSFDEKNHIYKELHHYLLALKVAIYILRQQ